MTDELDLSFDDYERGPSRHRRGSQQRGREDYGRDWSRHDLRGDDRPGDAWGGDDRREAWRGDDGRGDAWRRDDRGGGAWGGGDRRGDDWGRDDRTRAGWATGELPPTSGDRGDRATAEWTAPRQGRGEWTTSRQARGEWAPTDRGREDQDLAAWSPGEWDRDGEDADDEGRDDRGRGGDKRGRRKRRRGRSVFALLMVLVLFGILGAGAYYGVGRVRNFLAVKDYSGAGTGEVVIQVKKGEFASDIGNTLYTKDVVKSAAAFVAASNDNPAASKKIEPGYYKLRHHMKAKLALNALVARNADNTLANKVSTRVTIPEGKTAKQTFALLSQQTHIPVADFESAAKNPTALGVQSWWFKRSDGKQVAGTVEGFLYPSTYDFDPGANAQQILSAMVDQFNTVVGDLKFADFVQANRGGIMPYEALIVASLAQAEAGVPEDLGKVARVAYNRAYGGKFPCGCLQFDTSENYWLQLQGKDAKASKDLTYSELHDPKNPYNTHDKAGLPPGPIDNPGKTALQAAMDPPAGPWLYFVAIDKQGHSGFATTQAEFDKLTAQACAAKVTC